MARDFPERPMVGVGVVVWRGDDVLLVRRGRAPRKGEWGLPGGAQELGETLFEAAAREVREETGVAIEPRSVLTAVDSITPAEDGRVRFHYTLVEVDADWRSGEAAAADDVDDVRWAGAADVERLVEWAATREVITLARERRRPVRRRGPPPRLKPRPRMGRLMQSPLGAMLARPWLDEVTIRVLADWALPMSRAWAAAIAADGEHDRFLAEIPLPAGAIVRSPWLARSLEDVRRAAAALRRADATWTRALFDPGSDEAAGVAAEEARLDAANALNLLRLRFAVFARARRVPACRWAIPSPQAVEAVHGAALAAPESAYDLTAALPEVRVSRGLASALGRDGFLTFASPSGLVASPCWARVFTPEGVADPPTVIHLHGICMEQDHVRTPLREVETWVRAGVRVIAAEAPWHGRRRLPGRYGGEPLVATAPLGLLDHFATHVRELAVLTRWARATSRGAIGWSGLSLGALTIQVAAGHAMRWPAACRADAMLLSTTADGIEEMGISGSLGRAFGVGPALEAAGWTPDALRRWRPLVEAPEAPYMGAQNVFMVLGSRDTVTPFERGIALANRWQVPEGNLHIREQGHFSVPAGLMVDDRPIEAFARALGAG